MKGFAPGGVARANGASRGGGVAAGTCARCMETVRWFGEPNLEAAKLAAEENHGRQAAARAWKEEKVPARGGVGSRRSRRLGGALNGGAGQSVGGNSSDGGVAELRQSWR